MVVSPLTKKHIKYNPFKRVRHLSFYPMIAPVICLLLFFLITMPTLVQSDDSPIKVELVAETFDGEAIIHVRLPRAVTIDEALLSPINNESDDIILTFDNEPLPITRFIMLDASDRMVNLQSVVRSNISRFWRTGEHPTSLIFYSDEVTYFEPGNEAEFLDNNLLSYNINPGVPACHGDAIAQLNTLTRDYDRSWRILLVTPGDFSNNDNCVNPDLPVAPTWLDIFVLAEPSDELNAVVNRNEGQFYPGSLQTVASEITPILEQWSQSSYALRGNIPEGWNSDAAFELDIRLSDGSRQIIELGFRDYTVTLPATATPAPTATIETPTETPTEEATIAAATEVIATEAIVDTTEPPATSSETGGSSNVAILLIIGAILFVIGAVVLALALSRVRRAPVKNPAPQTANFYETLNNINNDASSSLTATRVRERNIVSSDGLDPQTQIASLDDTHMEGDDISDSDEELDEILLTQVLSDKRFQSMMEQSSNDDEIVGWLRLIVSNRAEDGDYELKRRGAVIGRSQECDIQITGDRAISRQHARLDVRSNGQVTVSRLSAVNPVVVGGVQISNRHPLAPNDVIHLSDETRLIFIAREEIDPDMDTEIQIDD